MSVEVRVPEGNSNLETEADISEYDRVCKFKARWEKKLVGRAVSSGITSGRALEIGPGPGYFGIMMALKSRNLQITGLEISPIMVPLAEENARGRNLDSKMSYVLGDAHDIPFAEDSFDGAFTHDSMHHWEDPVRVFDELHRVVRPGGVCFISDMVRTNVKSKTTGVFPNLIIPRLFSREAAKGFIDSVKAAYTEEEVREFLEKSDFDDYQVSSNYFHLWINARVGVL